MILYSNISFLNYLFIIIMNLSSDSLLSLATPLGVAYSRYILYSLVETWDAKVLGAIIKVLEYSLSRSEV